MNVVTFETAKRLKDAGFTQPEPFDGLMLYNKYGHKFVMCDCGFMDASAVGGWMCSSVKKYETGDTFAPSATDIIFKMGKDFILYHNGSKWCCKTHLTFIRRSNPAEACAAAWLAIHEKPGTEAENQ